MWLLAEPHSMVDPTTTRVAAANATRRTKSARPSDVHLGLGRALRTRRTAIVARALSAARGALRTSLTTAPLERTRGAIEAALRRTPVAAVVRGLRRRGPVHRSGWRGAGFWP